MCGTRNDALRVRCVALSGYRFVRPGPERDGDASSSSKREEIRQCKSSFAICITLSDQFLPNVQKPDVRSDGGIVGGVEPGVLPLDLLR